MSQRRTLIAAALAGLVALIQPAAAQVAIGFGGGGS